jgi:hypothetical protein
VSIKPETSTHQSFSNCNLSRSTFQKFRTLVNMQDGDKVVLKTFLGSIAPEEETDDLGNYWKLVGTAGVIMEVKENKALVLFDKQLDELGLENHNPIKNTLFINHKDISVL